LGVFAQFPVEDKTHIALQKRELGHFKKNIYLIKKKKKKKKRGFIKNKKSFQWIKVFIIKFLISNTKCEFSNFKFRIIYLYITINFFFKKKL